MFILSENMLAMPTCQILKRHQSIIDTYQPAYAVSVRKVIGPGTYRGISIDDSVCGTCLKSLDRKLVAVEIFTFQCEEKLASADFAAVSQNRAAFFEYIV